MQARTLIFITPALLALLACEERAATIAPAAPVGTTTAIPIPAIPAAENLDPLLVGALGEATRTVAVSPSDGEAWGRLGQLYHGSEHYRLAIDCYRRAWQLSPASAEWPYLLATITADRGLSDDTLEALEAALAIDPALLAARRLQGDTRLLENRLEEAAESYEQLLEASPGEPWGLIGLAKVRRRQGRDDEAAALLERALELRENHREAAYLLAGLRRDQGRSTEAEKLLGVFAGAPTDGGPPDPLLEAVKEETPSLQNLFRRANTALSANRWDEAQPLYEEILRHQPKDFGALLNLAMLHGRAGRPSEALALMERAVAVRPGDATARVGLAMGYAGSGRVAEAREQVREALRLDPRHPGARRLAGGLGL